MRIVVAYRGIPHARGYEIGAMLARGFRRLGHQVSDYGNIYQTADLVGYGPGNPPVMPLDLLVWTECNDADPQYLELLDIDCPKVLWDIDTMMHLSFTEKLSREFDAVMVANLDAADGHPGWHYLPMAADEHLFRPDLAQVRDVDACLIGTLHGPRKAFCSEAGIEAVTGIFGDDYARLLARLKINVHHYTAAGDTGGLVVGRPFETLASGGLLLAPAGYRDKNIMTPGEHYVTYADAQSARGAIGQMLEDAKARRMISRAGRAHVLAHHTYRNRAESILEAMEG